MPYLLSSRDFACYFEDVMRTTNSSVQTAKPTPTTVAGNSTKLTVKSDTSDDRGIRHVVIQTTATGNSQESYKAAECQAHEWKGRTDENIGKGVADPVAKLFAWIKRHTDKRIVVAWRSLEPLCAVYTMTYCRAGKVYNAHHVPTLPEDLELAVLNSLEIALNRLGAFIFIASDTAYQFLDMSHNTDRYFVGQRVFDSTVSTFHREVTKRGVA